MGIVVALFLIINLILILLLLRKGNLLSLLKERKRRGNYPLLVEKSPV